MEDEKRVEAAHVRQVHRLQVTAVLMHVAASTEESRCATMQRTGQRARQRTKDSGQGRGQGTG